MAELPSLEKYTNLAYRTSSIKTHSLECRFLIAITQEYDYVFDVDIEEGSTPLKLPFNLSEDPWLAAQKFIHKHDLSQYYLEQVANFIIKNTKGVTLQAPTVNYQDPFTGWK